MLWILGMVNCLDMNSEKELKKGKFQVPSVLLTPVFYR